MRVLTMTIVLLSAVLSVWRAQATEPSHVERMPSMLPVAEWQDGEHRSLFTISADDFLARKREPSVAATAAVTPGSAKGYVPKTKDDNTPWRFDMNQNGRRMTADEFDAWMKAKGIRVATGKPAAAPSAEMAATAACVPTTETAC